MYYIRFSDNIKKMMISHTFKDATKECGGFLYGNISKVNDDVFCDVDAIYYEDMLGTDSEFIFTFSYIRNALLKERELDGLVLIGSYHSHGNYQAYLSDGDRSNIQRFFGKNKITVVYSPKYSCIVGEYMDDELICHKAKILTKK